MHIQPE
jgi:hypothetical protein